MHTRRVEVDVEDCGRVHLLDEEYHRAAGDTDDSTPRSLGSLIRVEGGVVDLGIALQWGEVPFTVTVSDQDPGADLDGYEDVAEASFESPTGRVFLLGWCMDFYEEKVARLPPLPAGPGTYRLRYHVRGMDEERYLADDHYLQIWPAPRHAPAVLKSTSECCRYLLDPEAWEAATQVS
ncbi:hypothetical protein ACFQ08_09225 [Streptosporangium algeriense]|uniref:Uncharacterized protein n=1 Tax=Streptosporangium algeriense TaxID=1682748 RepID=A0ABW3DLT5_9ACTN